MSNYSENKARFVFNFFCLWTFVLLCRPQDMLPVLSFIRPAVVTGVLTLGMVAIHYNKLSTTPFFQERQVKFFTLLLLIMILGIPTSLYAKFSFNTIFRDYINVALFFYIFYKVVDSEEKLRSILLLGCLGNGLYSAFSVITGSLGDGRLYFGKMFDPNDLAFFALGFLPLNLIFVSRDNPLWVRFACLVCFGIDLLLILLTGSRGGLVALGAVIVLLLFFKSTTIKASLKCFSVALGFVILCLSPINTERYMTIFTINQDYNVQGEEGRLALWKIGIRAMLSNPLTGVGVGCFNNAVGDDRSSRGLNSSRWQTAHNSLVQIGSETGVFGLFLFLLLSLNVFKIFRQVKKAAVSCNLVKIGEMGLVGFAGLFTSAMFLSQAYSFYWAFYVILSAVANQLMVKEQSFAARQV